MSKMDDLRRMREAAHDQAMARKSRGTAASGDTETPAARRASTPVPPTKATTKTTKKATATPSASATEALCGHRSMNGRTCTRELGHAAKSHRYS